jgi:hypothetical protein
MFALSHGVCVVTDNVILYVACKQIKYIYRLIPQPCLIPIV